MKYLMKSNSFAESKRYLESFENEKKFRKGDIVKLRRNNSNLFIINNIQKYYDNNNNKQQYISLSYYYPEYDDETTDYNITQRKYTTFDSKDIRFLTEKEKEEVELKKAVKKYNL